MNHVSRLLTGIAVLVTLLVPGSIASGQDDVRQPIVSLVAEVVRDSDGDGFPDLEHQNVNISGRITLPFGTTPYGDNTAFLQDGTGGILLVGKEIALSQGDSVRIAGTVSMHNGSTALKILGTDALQVERSLPVAEWIEGDEIDLSHHINKRVEVGGTIIQVDRFEERSLVVVNRPGGPVQVQVPHLGDGNDYLRAEIGDFVRVKGVLVNRKTSTFPPVQLLVSGYGDFTPSIPVESFVRPTILIVGLIVCAVLFLMLSKIRQHLKSRREHPYKAMFDNAGFGLVAVDANMKVNYANRMASKLLGHSPVNIRSQNIEKLLSISSGAESFSDAVNEIRRGNPKIVSAYINQGAADERMLDVTLSMAKLGGRKVIVAGLHDVTSHADDVEKYKQFHEELLDGMPVEVAILSLQGKYLYMNSAGLVDNITKDWLIGKTDVELCKRMNLAPDIGLRRRAHWRRAVTSGKPVHFEEVLGAGSDVQHILRTFQPIKDSTGEEVAAVVAFGMDITELKESRKLLDQARGEVNQVNQLKESFLENINHEFRTPITGIIGFAEILEDEVHDEQREFVNMIERNGRRLMNTLNAVLDLAGLNNNEFDLSPTVFNIVDEAKAIIDGSREMAEQKGLFLKLEAARPEINALADQVCFARVIQNLIDNSIKFTDAGGIIVEVDGDDKGVHIRVLDTGVGIDNEFVPLLFNDFNRVSGTSSGSFEGVGVGLGITRRLVELMNGTISAESQKEEGSIFSITLPRAFPSKSKHGGGKPRILLVDDSSDINTMIQYMLSEFFEIERAVNLRELEVATKRKKFDVMMIDMALAKHDLVLKGIQEAREKYEDQKVPLIGISEGKSRRTSEDGEENADAVDYLLAKPFKKSELLTFMSMILIDRDIFSDRPGQDDDDEVYLKTG